MQIKVGDLKRIISEVKTSLSEVRFKSESKPLEVHGWRGRSYRKGSNDPDKRFTKTIKQNRDEDQLKADDPMSLGDVEKDMSVLEVGDLVDVDAGENAHAGVRVVDFVSDVRSASGMHADESWPGSEDFKGTGFVGELEQGEQMIFSFKQVVPGSKESYYFPDDLK